ncbi:uncharacterized protein LOC101221137 [Cucumis sativus]|uniref:EGF-like domain-containing protein n=1 Tax=Cucumis sativus TaxID=3659 RepID=A0A0A0LLE2_CUCSA|nr:uncharacterized protein LOC101221137 [Cucumis sativus]KGN60821.1 hypothetical protein Csa_019267 [Cucumis sativus]
MAISSHIFVDFLSIFLLLLLPISIVIADDPPFPFDKVCEEVNCGKGNCTPGVEHLPFGFSCECDPGWKRTRDNDDDLVFLPCVIPNCTLDYGCQPAPPPVPEKPVPKNSSFFNPCYWAYCGQGDCVQNRTYIHTCECQSGYYNLLNISTFPCYSDCTIGSDCAKLGIKVANVNGTDNGSGSGNGTGHGNSILPGKFQWVALAILFAMAMELWN